MEMYTSNMYEYIHVIQAQKLEQLIHLMNRSILCFFFFFSNDELVTGLDVYNYSSKCIKEFLV